MTALDLISSALRLIGVVAAGEPTPIDTANDSLLVLNDMIDSWNADRLAIYTTVSNDFPFVIGTQSYTLGTGGNFNIARPPKIDAMSTILLTNPSNPVEIPIQMVTVQEWQTEVPVKDVPGTFPLICYDDGNFPLRTLNFWPIPGEADDVRIYSWQPLPAQSLAAQVSFPPGYSEAMRYNLAIRLAAEFEAQPSAAVASIAVESLARVKTMNAPSLELRSDLLPNSADYNWRADMFGIAY